MIIDNDLIMSEKQAVTETAVSTKVLDFEVPGEAIVAPYFVVSCVEDATSADSSATVNISLETSDDKEFTSSEVKFSSGEIPLSGLKAGLRLVATRLPLGLKRYVRTKYTVSQPLTAGKFDAFLALDIDVRY